MTRRDVVVVGAGPAGALAAREIARGGASVLLLDRADFPRWKVCGACLSAGALEVLASVGLGALPDELGAVPLHSLALAAPKRRVRLPLDGARALSRDAFDHALVREAEDSGVEFWPGARATLGPVDGEHRMVSLECRGTAVAVRAAVVLDATGLGRGLAATDKGGTTISPGSRIGLAASFLDPSYPVRSGDLHMVVGREGYVGIVRVESGVLNVAAAVDPGALRRSGPGQVIETILTSCDMPPLRGECITEWRGTPPLTRVPDDVGAERLLQLGDASGYVEPFTGEGMCWALAGAKAVAPLALAGAARWEVALLEAWRGHHRSSVRRERSLCRVIAPALRRPWLVEGAIAMLGMAPGLAGPLVRRAARAPRPMPAYSA